MVDSCHRSHLLVDGHLGITPHPTPLSIIISRHLSTHRRILGLWASWLPRQLLSCTLQACKPYSCPISRPKKEPRGGGRDICRQRQGSYMSVLKGPQRAPSREKQSPAAMFATPPGHRRLPFLGRTDLRFAHQLPRKPVAGALPSQPLRLMTNIRADTDVSLL